MPHRVRRLYEPGRGSGWTGLIALLLATARRRLRVARCGGGAGIRRASRSVGAGKDASFPRPRSRAASRYIRSASGAPVFEPTFLPMGLARSRVLMLLEIGISTVFHSASDVDHDDAPVLGGIGVGWIGRIGRPFADGLQSRRQHTDLVD
jgi:hypothetical protein